MTWRSWFPDLKAAEKVAVYQLLPVLEVGQIGKSLLNGDSPLNQSRWVERGPWACKPIGLPEVLPPRWIEVDSNPSSPDPELVVINAWSKLRVLSYNHKSTCCQCVYLGMSRLAAPTLGSIRGRLPCVFSEQLRRSKL